MNIIKKWMMINSNQFCGVSHYTFKRIWSHDNKSVVNYNQQMQTQYSNLRRQGVHPMSLQ